jgi:hypothetical protein
MPSARAWTQAHDHFRRRRQVPLDCVNDFRGCGSAVPLGERFEFDQQILIFRRPPEIELLALRWHAHFLPWLGMSRP